MSHELRRELIDLRDERMLEAFQAELLSISDDLLCPGEKAKPVSRSILGRELLLALPRARRPATL
jgi:hypothetical protein